MSLVPDGARSRTTRSAALLLLGALALSSWMAWRIDRAQVGTPPDEVLYLQSPRTVRVLSLGYTGLAACIYWTRAVQYFGEKNVAKAKRFDLLLPLLDLTVSLDPHLIPAYQFGAIFLAQPPPYGAGLPDQAVAFVEHGIRDNPNEWRLYYHLGFIQYMERKDYAAAADAFERAARTAGNPPWMNAMPALMRQRAGDIQTARILWTQMYEQAENPAMRRNAAMRLVALRVDDDVQHLEALAADYMHRAGNYPASWAQLISAGMLGGIPADPSNSAYVLLPGGHVVVQDAKRFPFITRGVPEGQHAPETITKESQDVPNSH